MFQATKHPHIADSVRCLIFRVRDGWSQFIRFMLGCGFIYVAPFGRRRRERLVNHLFLSLLFNVFSKSHSGEDLIHQGKKMHSSVRKRNTVTDCHPDARTRTATSDLRLEVRPLTGVAKIKDLPLCWIALCQLLLRITGQWKGEWEFSAPTTYSFGYLLLFCCGGDVPRMHAFCSWQILWCALTPVSKYQSPRHDCLIRARFLAENFSEYLGDS